MVHGGGRSGFDDQAVAHVEVGESPPDQAPTVPMAANGKILTIGWVLTMAANEKNSGPDTAFPIFGQNADPPGAWVGGRLSVSSVNLQKNNYANRVNRHKTLCEPV